MTQTNGDIGSNNIELNDPFYKHELLKDLCEKNAEFFVKDSSVLGKSLYTNSSSIIVTLENIRPLIEYFRGIYSLYDFDENTPGNGYRSYILMVDVFIDYGIKVTKQISLNRNSYFFRKGSALKELEAVEQGLCSLCQMITNLKELVDWSEVGSLYPRSDHSAEELLSKAVNLNQYCFYGRCLGIQFCESMQTVLKGLAILMASFSELFYSNGGVIGRATSSLWNSSKYLLNPELRAKRIVNISQYASVNFCKQFWFLGEMETMKRLPNFVSPYVPMNRIIILPPEPMTTQRLDGSIMDVPVPSAHTGPAPLSVRLMSGVKRQGMLGEANSKVLVPPSEGLFFHCHGGGFVAQSSRSHEMYLCHWAKSIDVPILSVDYSLAPEAPFPRAIEDVFYAYCWALNHLSMLGTTGQRIVVGGDSAGGNLVLGLTIKCLTEGIRPPDGIFIAYTPVIISIVPSPARLLCLMDPLLPLGFLTGCLKAYACTPDKYEAAAKGFEEKLRRHSKSQNSENNGSTSQFYVKSVTLQEKTVDIGEDTLKETKQKIVESIHSEMTIDISTNIDLNSETLLINNPDIIQLNDNPTTEGNFTNHNENDFIAGFLKKYVHKNSDPEQTIVKVECEIINSGGGETEVIRSNDKESVQDASGADEFEELMLPCPLEMLKFDVPCDSLLSPYYADENILRQFPAVSIMTLHMDPCLDDCVEFAKKLRRFDRKVTLDILGGLPHGFLNFSLLSKEAYEGSRKCIDRIIALLDIPSQLEHNKEIPQGS